MMETYCGFNPEKPCAQNLAERLAQCAKCIKLAACGYAKSITLKMVKEATEESTLNIQEIARNCKSFAEFHQVMAEKCDKLHRESEPDDKLFKESESVEPQKPNRLSPHGRILNLPQLARQSMTFSDFNERAEQAEQTEPMFKSSNDEPTNLLQLARTCLDFNEYRERAKWAEER